MKTPRGSRRPGVLAGVLVLALTVSLLVAADREGADQVSVRDVPAAGLNSAELRPYLDYAWINAPDDLGEMREIREQLKVPGLLWQACEAGEGRDFGEDYMAVQLARVEILRMLDTQAGTDAIHQALLPGRDEPAMFSPRDSRACLDRLAPDWAQPLGSGRARQAGWELVRTKIEAVPALHGTPGTDDVQIPTTQRCRAAGEGNWDISMALLIRFWLLARDHYSPAEQAEIDRLVSRRAWLQGGASAYDTEVCKVSIFGVSVPETENHSLLILTTRFLHNEWLPAVTPAEAQGSANKWVLPYSRDFNTDNRTNGVRTRLLNGFQTVLRKDFLEYNSRPYSRLQMIGLLNLYDFAKDESVRAPVRTVLDLLAAKAATESMGELRSPPFRRRVEHADDPLFHGDPVSPMMQVWVGDLSPSRTPVQSPGRNFAPEATVAASSRYRPPDVLTDLMLTRAHRNYFQAFNGRGQDERAFGQPDFVISGGGVQTTCPYRNRAVGPDCPGAGNDSGTVQPIVLIPRRTASRLFGLRASPLPTSDELVRTTNPPGRTVAGNSCIGFGYACGAAISEGRPAWAKQRADCRRDLTDPATNDRITALRFDSDCVSRPHFPLTSCFFVYLRQVATMSQPLSYLVTHNCDARKPAEVLSLFQSFVDYLNGPGGPRRSRRVDGLTGSSQQVTFRMPSSLDGPIAPGRDVVLRVRSASGNRALFHSTLDPAWSNPPARAAVGQVAATENAGDTTRLVLRNWKAGETLRDSSAPGGVAIGESDPRRFDVHAAVIAESDHDQVRVQLTQLSRPSQVHSAQVIVRDLAGSGLERARVVQLYRFNELTAPQRRIEVSVPQDQRTVGNTYRVEVCVWWWKFKTADDYRTDPQGTQDQRGSSWCYSTESQRSRIRPGLPSVTPFN